MGLQGWPGEKGECGQAKAFGHRVLGQSEAPEAPLPGQHLGSTKSEAAQPSPLLPFSPILGATSLGASGWVRWGSDAALVSETRSAASLWRDRVIHQAARSVAMGLPAEESRSAPPAAVGPDQLGHAPGLPQACFRFSRQRFQEAAGPCSEASWVSEGFGVPAPQLSRRLVHSEGKQRTGPAAMEDGLAEQGKCSWPAQPSELGAGAKKGTRGRA